MSEWRLESLDRFVQSREIRLGRGDVISREDIFDHPGPYPIYSSSAQGDGRFGQYGKYMFDEELITWSVDGGGRLFYRPKHKYSVTNVCGYLRLHTDAFDYRFLHYLLDFQHRSITFDYTTKAHPSVIRHLYEVAVIPVTEQRKIARILTTVDKLIEKTEALIAKYQSIMQGMMHDLFTRGVDSSGQLRPTQEQAPDLYKQSELGWIPKDCSIKALKEVAERVVVGLALSTTHAYRERGVALIRNQNIRKGFFEDDDMLFLDPHFASLYPNKAARKGDVLTVRTGANVGDTALVPDKYVGCPTFTTLITSPDTSVLNPKYLVHYIVSKFGVFELNRLLVGGGKENLNVGEFVKLRVVLPPVESQTLFVRALTTLENRLDAERVLLQKYKRQKTGLMQDLLTGKVRVTVEEAEEVDQ